MAKRKNKRKNQTEAQNSNASKNSIDLKQKSSNPENTRIENTKKTDKQTENHTTQHKHEPSKGISAITCIAGMFLSLVLGIYLGTLAPDFAHYFHKKTTFANKTPIAQMAKPSQQAQTVSEPDVPATLKKQIEILEKDISVNPTAANYAALGNLYFDTGQSAKAVAAYEKSLEKAPDNPDVLTDLGIMYRELKEFQKAVECFRKAAQLNPKHTNALFNEGVVLAYDLSDKEGARAAWQKLIEIQPDAHSPTGQPVKTMMEALQ